MIDINQLLSLSQAVVASIGAFLASQDSENVAIAVRDAAGMESGRTSDLATQALIRFNEADASYDTTVSNLVAAALTKPFDVTVIEQCINNLHIQEPLWNAAYQVLGEANATSAAAAEATANAQGQVDAWHANTLACQETYDAAVANLRSILG